MSEVRDERGERDLEPAEAFSVIASETRLDILESLWEFDDRPIRFSELFDSTDLGDSAQFNYHLQELTDQFVVKSEAGYDLSHTGGQVIRALRAGTYTHSPELDPFEVSGACTRCGGPLEAKYDDEQFSITCTDCGKAHSKYSFPPGGLEDRTEDEIATAFDERVRHLHCLSADGVCPECAGRMHTTLTRQGECCLDVSLRAEHRCERCRHSRCSPVGLVLLDEAPVAAFYDDHGITLTDRPYWTLPWCVDDAYYEVNSIDPWEIEVSIPVDGEQLRVTLDEELQVVETTRERCDGTTECASHD
jgi:hypothetical protein